MYIHHHVPNVLELPSSGGARLVNVLGSPIAFSEVLVLWTAAY